MIEPYPATSTPYELPPGLTDIEALGEKIATLSAQIQAATYRLLVLLARFDEQDGWACGFPSCAHWLHWRTGIDLGAAREKVRVARALEELPLLSAEMQCGRISYSKVRALTRVATANNEEELLGVAQAATAAQVERIVRAWRRLDRSVELQDATRRRACRSVTVFTDDDGMVVIRARLEPEAGAVVLEALEAAEEKIYEKSKKDPDGEIVPAEQRRADALVLVAESALAGGLDPGTSGDRYQVVVHVVDEAPRISAETPAKPSVKRRLPEWRIACDASKVVMRETSDGETLDVGRKTRTIPPSVRRALENRDAGCRFPGCTARHCDAHHVKHWADGGETKLSNLVLLCRRHHHAVHEEGFQVILDDRREARFFRPDGRPLDSVPAGPSVAEQSFDALIERLREDGVVIPRPDSLPVWDGTPLDLALVMGGLWRPLTASEKLLPN